MNVLKTRIFSKPPTKFALVHPPNASSCKNVLLIDNSVKDAKIFSDSVNSSTFPIIYSNTSTKNEILALLKASFTSIDRIGFVFASNIAIINKFLDGKPFFSKDDLLTNPYSENVEFLISILKEFNVKNIDFLACDTLNYPDWVNYYSILQKETGVQVGASNDKTGNIKYGGDWIMENTSQDIEICYFTKNIEYYKYLLDTWTLSPNAFPLNITYCASVVNNNYVYVLGGIGGNYELADTVYYAQLNNDGSVGVWNTTTALPTPMAGMTSIINNNYIYIFGGGVGNIEDGEITNNVYYAQINIDGSIGSWITSTSILPTGVIFPTSVVNNNYVYILGGGGNNQNITNTVYYAQLNIDGSVGSWTESLSTLPTSVIFHTSIVNNNYVYVIGGQSQTGLSDTVYYAQLNIDGSVGSWITTTSLPISIFGATSVVNNNYVYVICGETQSDELQTGLLDTIYYAAINNDGSVGTWSLSSIYPFPLTVSYHMSVLNNNYIYVIGGTDNNNILNTVYYIIASTLPYAPLMANICFPAGTLVQTDQGKIAIDQIKPYIQTINRKPIKYITKTISTDEYLVEFKKNSLGPNSPSQNTLISYEHKILFNGQMCTARSFLNKFNNVVRVKYTGEFLYNVLMEEYSKMSVNNLICETLHPNNEIARLYNKK
jgi:N-acetylneuraminic acid mutarotase